MPARRLTGIFCLEGEWDPNLRNRNSVEPILELLERLGIARTIHRDVATRPELEYYLRKWGQKRYADYSVLYLASHGLGGKLELGQGSVTLAELADLLEGKCAGRVVYFGCCLVLNQQNDVLQEFARKTGAKAVLGYSRQIDWLDSAAFEVLLLERLARGNRTDAFFNHLHRDHGAFAEKLGLVVSTKNTTWDA
ncbi:DUF6642 family protein [Kribbella sp. NBC_01245]|uniref:DUF6642 family protein n=1 Tax=Kribbella sp. NBC_01245 TaxID=2903578 RepID=UPI002E2C8167|nr:DUF6642 family protein [Kribbella sp. NBC_01245]